MTPSGAADRARRPADPPTPTPARSSRKAPLTGRTGRGADAAKADVEPGAGLPRRKADPAARAGRGEAAAARAAK
ncbi:hypothetical protein, partial [Kribbella sancticallisti]|uniref:hypothetical protein n=1 Tax=Kribbella sancticallisti TaxID=460087 RepID=UPI0031D2237F